MLKHYLRSLLLYKKRVFLSIVGISLGMAILTIVFFLGESLKAYVNLQLNIFGPKVIFVAPKVPELNEVASLIAYAQQVKITTLKEKDLNEILKLPFIEAGVGNVATFEWVSYKNKEKYASIVGTLPDYPKIDSSFKLEKGRIFSQKENLSLAKVAVIGSQIKKDFFENEDPIGKTIKIKNQKFKVIGVLKERGGFGFFDLDSIIYLPLKTAQKLLLGIDYLSEIDLKVKQISLIEPSKKSIEKILRKNHRISDPKKDDFQVSTSQEIIEKTGKIISIINILLILLALVSLIVGGVGIMNMMLISVHERTKEIGLRKAIGATKSDIFWQFLIETSFISLLGALVGLVLGLILTFSFSKIISLFYPQWSLKLSFLPFIFIPPLALLEGFLFGLWPAMKAAQKTPVEALRS